MCGLSSILRRFQPPAAMAAGLWGKSIKHVARKLKFGNLSLCRRITEKDLYESGIPFRFISSVGTRVHVLACWFGVIFDGSTVQRWLATAPAAPTTHWYQLRCVLAHPIYFMPGQEKTGRLHMVAHKSQSHTLNPTLSAKMLGLGAEQVGILQTSSGKLGLKEPHYWMSQILAYLMSQDQQPNQLLQTQIIGKYMCGLSSILRRFQPPAAMAAGLWGKSFKHVDCKLKFGNPSLCRRITAEELYEFSIPLRFASSTGTRSHGLACWFDVIFDGSTVQRWLTTAPGAPTTNWYQLRCVLAHLIYYMPGQEITGRLHMVAHKAQSYTLHLMLSAKMSGLGSEQGGILQTSSHNLDLKEPYYWMSQLQAYPMYQDQQLNQLLQTQALFWQHQNYYGVNLTSLHGTEFQGYFAQPVLDALVAPAIYEPIALNSAKILKGAMDKIVAYASVFSRDKKQLLLNSAKILKGAMDKIVTYASVFSRDKKQFFSSSAIPMGKGSQPMGTILFMLQWPPSYGVNHQRFVIHAVCPKIKFGMLESNFFYVDKELEEELVVFWPDLECYGNLAKYKGFWLYQYEKHGMKAGLTCSMFFRMGINFMNALPDFELDTDSFTIVSEVLSNLHAKLGVYCGLSSTTVRGYLYIDSQRYYSPRAIEQIYIASDENLVKRDIWKSLMGGDASLSDEIVLPQTTLWRYRSPDRTRIISYVPDQPNCRVHMLLQNVQERLREKIYMPKKPVSFLVLENEKKQEKMGVFVHSIKEVFDKTNEAFKKATKFPRLLVVVTDMDHVKWDRTQYGSLKVKIEDAIKRAIVVSHPTISIPISSGSNIKEKVKMAVCNWYKGKCLFAKLDEFEAGCGSSNSLRMTVHGTYGNRIVGDVESGLVSKGDVVSIVPSKKHVKVVEIYERMSAKYSTKDHAKQGDYILLEVEGDVNYIKEGYIICSKDNCTPLASLFEAKIYFLEDLTHKERVCVGYRAHLHIHYVVVKCEIVSIHVEEEGAMICKIKVDEPTPLEEFTVVPSLGEFVLLISRGDERREIASGKVTRILSCF